ncbi:MAG: DUF11 domain-containing protein [Bacteroidales bacterium]|jgi:uncharacterized repeat protein (TIGR01451 family)|nr:DUF11 domain-containing protein [Bacteroidales bacterium]
MNKRVIKRFFLPVLFSLGLSLNANAVKVHINSGNPAYPFPQFLEYACGGNLGTKLADGLTHAEMEQQIRDAYQLHANAFEYTGDEWAGIKYIKGNDGCPYDCTEGDGYALLAAAYMADKPTFDGLWMRTHDLRRYRTKKYSDCKPIEENYGYGPFSLGDQGGEGNSAADGDEDVALALYVAYKQWGEFMLDENGEKVLDACGNPISYKQELIEVVRGLVALSTKFANDGSEIRVNSGMIGLDGYARGGDTWAEVTSWAVNNPIVFADSTSIFSFDSDRSKMSMKNVKGISLFPENPGPNVHFIDYNAPAYYREFHDLLLSLSKELGVTNEWEAEQFRRAEASSDWLIGQLIAKNPYSVPTAGNCTVNEDGSVTTFEKAGALTDIRTAWRTISHYVWHGNPKYSWNPVTHQVEDGENSFEYGAAVRFSNYLNDPMNWNDNFENSCYEYGTFSVPISGPKTMPWQIDPMTGTYEGSSFAGLGVQKAMSSFAAIGAQDYNLMGEIYNIAYSLFDVKGKTVDGERVPQYFHGWFRQMGMMALTGNYAAPSQMEASSNLKIYRSVKDSVSSCRVGDTITYMLSYRNYGSKDAENVVITENLPEDFQFVEASDGGVYNSNTITWTLGKVPGFRSDSIVGAALDLTAPNLSKTMGMVSYRCVVRSNASGKYSPVATIKSKEGKESQTDNYPNYITATMQRNSIDIIPNALSVSKIADKDMLVKNDTIQFTVSYSNTDSLPFLTGGRPGVNFTVAGREYDSNAYRLMLRVNQDAIEPFINTGNYRITCFFGAEATHLQCGIEMEEGLSDKSLDDECFSSEKLSDDVVAFRTHFTDNLASNSIYSSWFPGDNGDRNELTSGSPIRLIMSIHDQFYKKLDIDKMWSKLESAKNDDLFYPVTPSYQIPDSIVDVDKVIKSACDVSEKVTETVLVEEYDGHTWRKILGEAPYNGIVAEDVVVTDLVPRGFEFLGFTGDTTGVKFEPTPDDEFVLGIITYRADKLGIGENGRFSYKCRHVGVSGHEGKVYLMPVYIESKDEKVKSGLGIRVEPLTSVKQIVEEDADAPVDVYNVNGQLLKRQVSPDKALEGLSKGVYMVGNKKAVVTK